MKSIYKVIKECESLIYAEFPHITPTLPDEITFIHTEELLQEYPRLSPKEREAAVARRYGAVFLIGIGQQLSDGTRHDGRAPDYDDWTTPNSDGYLGLNGDIIFWDTVLETRSSFHRWGYGWIKRLCCVSSIFAVVPSGLSFLSIGLC